jgi:hypothetical protein
MSKYQKFTSLVAAGAFAIFGLGVTSASAATLSTPGLTTCSTTNLTTSLACEGQYDGNDSNALVEGLFGYSGWIQIAKVEGSSGTSGILTTTAASDAKSGTWAADLSSYEVVMAVLKGSNEFSAYLLNLNFNSGTWSTTALLNNGENQPNLSHFSLYSNTCLTNDPNCGGGVKPPSPVPLPAGMPLLLVGLGAFGFMRRKARKAA